MDHSHTKIFKLCHQHQDTLLMLTTTERHMDVMYLSLVFETPKLSDLQSIEIQKLL